LYRASRALAPIAAFLLAPRRGSQCRPSAVTGAGAGAC